MRITVVGTGTAGRTLAAGLGALGHDVVVATRDPEATSARPEWDDGLRPLVPLPGAADDADLVVNATAGVASLEALQALGDLTGKIVLDVSNPLDFSAGFPPRLAVKDTDSLAEQLQRGLPGARVVKALNTMTAGVMLEPGLVGDGGTTVFVAGDDEEARAIVTRLLEAAGWRDVLDLGPLEAARGMEMWLPLWLRIMGALGTASFNLKIVR
jgi:8-hydroxy-5-deazaflavin:NADPH oxidoreductase